MSNKKTNDIAISVKNVNKTFKLPHEKQTSIKSAVVNSFRRKSYEVQHALKDVSFDVKKGEFFGIVGRNGSGKSTLLKCMAGVYTPNSGEVNINGTLVPFIELGVGFNPELSGRDNVFLNGALLGFSRQQMLDLYDEIVEFAELEQFMDQKLKNYSSGMQVRLAFSIAIRAQGDILLLDEVLAVGDEAFQKKCFKYFSELKLNRKTVILVTHTMTNIEEFCDRALFMETGAVKEIGEPSHIAHLYRVANIDSLNAANKKSSKHGPEAYAEGLHITVKKNKAKTSNSIFLFNEEITVDINWEDDRVKNIGLALYTGAGKQIFAANTLRDNATPKDKRISYKLKLNVADGSYFFKIGLFGSNEREKIEQVERGPEFSVHTETQRSWVGMTELERSWRY